MKIISRLLILKKNLQFSCNVYGKFYDKISWFYQDLKKVFSSFDLYTVHGARILDVSVEIMLSPPS